MVDTHPQPHVHYSKGHLITMGNTNRYVADPTVAVLDLGLAIDAATEAEMLEPEQADDLRGFLDTLSTPVTPLASPLDPGVAKERADAKTGFLTVVLALGLDELVDGDRATIDARLGFLITGDADDADLLDDLQYEPLSIADGKMLLTVWVDARDWIAEHVCREEDCFERADDGDSYDGYCPTHADQHYGEDEN